MSKDDSEIIEDVLLYLAKTHNVTGERALDILEFAKRRQGELLDITQSKLNSSGSFEERMVCKHLGIIWNSKTKHGVDAVDPTTEKHIEIKTSIAHRNKDRGNQLFMSVMYALPTMAHHSRDEYIAEAVVPMLERFDEHVWAYFKAKGSKVTLQRIWKLDGKFVTLLVTSMARKNASASSVNFGAVVCSRCNSVHRLDYLKQCESESPGKDSAWYDKIVRKTITSDHCFVAVHDVKAILPNNEE